jgi:alpha-tubulin suppressor-like RCC1 family protein
VLAGGCGFRAAAARDLGSDGGGADEGVALDASADVDAGDAGGAGPDAGPVDALTGPDAALAPPVALALGAQHSCALLADGTVACWGDNGTGQLGIEVAGGGSVTPVRAHLLSGVTALVSGGGGHTCAQSPLGFFCWGDNTYAQIGGGTVVPTPTAVPGLDGTRRLVVGARNTCALKLDETVLSWGDAGSGQIGDGTVGGVVSSPRPVPMPSALDVAFGGLMDAIHACAIVDNVDRSLLCWGANAFDQLGDGSYTASPMTIPVPMVKGVSELALGRDHSCVRTGATVACWGSGTYGAVGDGLNAHAMATPVVGLDRVTQLVAGAFHNCARRDDQTVWCWGRNVEGQLGDGTRDSRGTPMPVPQLTQVEEVRAGALHTCARRQSGEVVCWGWNRNGQVGSGDYADQPLFKTVPWR